MALVWAMSPTLRVRKVSRLPVWIDGDGLALVILALIHN